MPSPDEIERESIVDSLHIEEIDPLTYRSTRLWIPINARYVLLSGRNVGRIVTGLSHPLMLAEADSADKFWD
jgi:hypothetical protein